MTEHRWSGWPGAWCLDCGIFDPIEACVAEDEGHRGPIVSENGINLTCPIHKITPCKEPGSHRYDPYYTPPTTFEEL